jgi:hypothetical protein
MEAVVCHDGTGETRYHRVGEGPQVILLGLDEETGWMTAAAGGLSARFRLFIPEVPPWAVEVGGGNPPGTSWLRGVIDGLGLDRPGLVAGPRLNGLVRRFRETDGDRLDRVALLREAPDAAALAALAEFLAGAG